MLHEVFGKNQWRTDHLMLNSYAPNVKNIYYCVIKHCSSTKLMFKDDIIQKFQLASKFQRLW